MSHQPVHKEAKPRWRNGNSCLSRQSSEDPKQNRVQRCWVDTATLYVHQVKCIYVNRNLKSNSQAWCFSTQGILDQAVQGQQSKADCICRSRVTKSVQNCMKFGSSGNALFRVDKSASNIHSVKHRNWHYYITTQCKNLMLSSCMLYSMYSIYR